MMRRQLFRCLRLRNLLILTIMVILLYLIKMLSDVDVPVYGNEVAQEALQSPDSLHALGYFVPTSLKKIDWHNYTQIEYESKRVGIGEQGRPAYLSKEESALEEELYSVNGFNGALSDKIPLNRSLPDIRHPACKTRKYIESLPTVSVVIPFHNEHWSTLLRTAFSVLNRSPEHLIKEIFLVDDASTKEFLGSKLESYLSRHLPKVSVVRQRARRGLIAARLAGAARARADALVFLDSHTEPNVNWLPPLLEPLALSPRTVVSPYIDVLSHDTLQYRSQDEGARGAFDWELFYKRLPLLPRDIDNMPEPFPSPVMAGGLFAISRAFFWELGGYDAGLDIWGGEQYELSFKIWQCGGRLVDAPCSRVGHIYRKFAPFPNPGHGDFVGKNYRRVAEVWMDEYAEYLYSRRPHYRDIDPGELDHQRALRTRLNCKPFRWYMTQVAFDLTAKYPPVEPGPYASGRVRPAAHHSRCVGARGAGQLAASGAGQLAASGAGQLAASGAGQLAASGAGQLAALTLGGCGDDAETQFVFTWHKDIKCSKRNMCWDLPESAARSPILLYPCHLGGGNQLWRYIPETKQIRHGTGDNCIQYSLEPAAVFIARCDVTETQRWDLDSVDGAALRDWDRTRDRVTGPVEDA